MGKSITKIKPKIYIMESKNDQGHTLYDWNAIINAGAPFQD